MNKEELGSGIREMWLVWKFLKDEDKEWVCKMCKMVQESYRPTCLYDNSEIVPRYFLKLYGDS